MTRIKARLFVLMAMSALLPFKLAVFASELRRWLREQQFRSPVQMYRNRIDAVIAIRAEALMRRYLQRQFMRREYGILSRNTF